MNPEGHFEEMWAKTMEQRGLFRNLNLREQAAMKGMLKLMFVATAEMVLAYLKEHPEDIPIVIVGGREEDGR